MFSTPKKLLSESEIMGLIGELLFLRDFLFEKYGKGEALSGWRQFRADIYNGHEPGTSRPYFT
jgi:hypothetical protein